MQQIRQSVPQFGGWDGKSTTTNYSVVFSQAREHRKKNKNEPMSLGNEREFLAKHHQFHHHDNYSLLVTIHSFISFIH